jgi:hypothetical protein
MIRAGTLTIVAVLIATVVVGCGGGGDASAPLPTPPPPKAVASCFRHEGVTAVYEKEEKGVTFVNGLVEGSASVSAEFTEDKAKSEEFLESYEAEAKKGSSLMAFELLDGAAVGVYDSKKPSNKQLIRACIER